MKEIQTGYLAENNPCVDLKTAEDAALVDGGIRKASNTAPALLGYPFADQAMAVLLAGPYKLLRPRQGEFPDFTTAIMANLQPFKVDVPATKIEQIRQRVAEFPWPSFQTPNNHTGEQDWKYGPPAEYMSQFCKFWLEKYDWPERQDRMNSLSYWKAQVEEYEIHFVHERGSGAATKRPPILLLHGWPYSFHSFHEIVPRLAHPERFGGNLDDSVDVIVPSMPGYAFSSPPSRPIGPREICRLYNILLTSVLGHSKYTAHGGDWGSYCAEILAFDYPQHCIGIHLTMISVRHHGAAPKSGEYPAGASEEEKDSIADEMRRWIPESAYARLQSFKPAKLGYAMADSPVGTAAWIVEAFHAWADLSSGRTFEAVFPFEVLIDEVMLYLVTDSFHTSTWLYVGEFEEGSNTLPEGKRIEVPVGILALPDPVFPMLPRAVIERSHDVVMYQFGRYGGHFPFYETRVELVGSIREFLRIHGK